MQKKAFSLVELIISIILLGIIITFLYSTVSTLQLTNKIFSTNEKVLHQKEKILTLLYDDIYLADTFKVQGRDSSLISLQTSNSLYDIEKPYVTWLVNKEDNTLLRFESVKKFTDMSIDNNHYYHISKVSERCKIFKVYQSIKKEHIMIHIQLDGEDPLVYEFAKPLFEKKKVKKKPKPKVQRP